MDRVSQLGRVPSLEGFPVGKHYPNWEKFLDDHLGRV